MLNTEIDFKEQMIETRRTQILVGAARVFAEKGYHKATTKEIARAAGIAEGTIYNYFANKRELLLAMVAMIATRSFKSKILDHSPNNTREFLTTVLRDRYEVIKEYGHVIAPLLAEMFADADLREAIYNELLKPILILVEQYMQHHIDAGRLRPINPLIITRTIIGAMVINAASKVSKIESRYEDISADSMIDQIVSLILDGLVIDDHCSKKSSEKL
jgi:AcrR family transcriptional regulator